MHSCLSAAEQAWVGVCRCCYLVCEVTRNQHSLYTIHKPPWSECTHTTSQEFQQKVKHMPLPAIKMLSHAWISFLQCKLCISYHTLTCYTIHPSTQPLIWVNNFLPQLRYFTLRATTVALLAPYHQPQPPPQWPESHKCESVNTNTSLFIYLTVIHTGNSNRHWSFSHSGVLFICNK